MVETVSTSVSVVMNDPLAPEYGKRNYSCDFSLTTASEDNDGNPEAGKAVSMRLFKGSDVSNVQIKSTTGRVVTGGTGRASVGVDSDVYVTLNGSNTATLPYPAIGSVTITEQGTLYRRDGSASGSNQYVNDEKTIQVQEGLYGVLKVQYTTYYTKVIVTPGAVGTTMVIAIGDCASGSVVSTTASVTVSEPGQGDEQDDAPEDPEEIVYDCEVSISIEDGDNVDEDGNSTDYEIGSNYFARVLLGSDVGSISVINTLGTISLVASDLPVEVGGSGDDEISVSFAGTSKESLPYKYVSGLSSTATGTFFDERGDEIDPPVLSASGDDVTTAKKCYGSYTLTYTSAYEQYVFTPEESGEGSLAVISTNCGGNITNSTVDYEVPDLTSSSCCSSCCSSCDSSDSSSEALTVNVRLRPKDFVTGAALPGAKISINGKAMGTTDDSGEILLIGLKTETVYRIRAEKDGYLTTDSDSLSNDEFIIKAE
jgi:hypothetical protein